MIMQSTCQLDSNSKPKWYIYAHEQGNLNGKMNIVNKQSIAKIDRLKRMPLLIGGRLQHMDAHPLPQPCFLFSLIYYDVLWR